MDDLTMQKIELSMKISLSDYSISPGRKNIIIQSDDHLKYIDYSGNIIDLTLSDHIRFEDCDRHTLLHNMGDHQHVMTYIDGDTFWYSLVE